MTPQGQRSDSGAALPEYCPVPDSERSASDCLPPLPPSTDCPCPARIALAILKRRGGFSGTSKRPPLRALGLETAIVISAPIAISGSRAHSGALALWAEKRLACQGSGRPTTNLCHEDYKSAFVIFVSRRESRLAAFQTRPGPYFARARERCDATRATVGHQDLDPTFKLSDPTFKLSDPTFKCDRLTHY